MKQTQDQNRITITALENDLIKIIETLNPYLKELDTDTEQELIQELINHCNRMIMYREKKRNINHAYW